MPGSTITSCDNKEFDQAEMPTGKDPEENVVNKTFEGALHSWDESNRGASAKFRYSVILKLL
jgi:hypothetical protein